jgi:hypothetical protein
VFAELIAEIVGTGGVLATVKEVEVVFDAGPVLPSASVTTLLLSVSVSEPAVVEPADVSVSVTE